MPSQEILSFKKKSFMFHFLVNSLLKYEIKMKMKLISVFLNIGYGHECNVVIKNC